ncbi:Serine/threonine-protein kinase ATM [Dendrobium catenatum]|uniref:Serine/threonine-protein kinase ATM n=1 Tax=Dendrobium catenatum TaxID=906689 RepID=A0A2I0WYZ9_9ASPA|nr:Serine/threonine-protein kinase ATM [Dendrobium catenatum]
MGSRDGVGRIERGRSAEEKPLPLRFIDAKTERDRGAVESQDLCRKHARFSGYDADDAEQLDLSRISTGNWSKALEYCDLLVRSASVQETESLHGELSTNAALTSNVYDGKTANWKYCKGLMKSLQNIGTSHVLDVYSQGLMANIGHFKLDSEFTELQYEAAWRAGNWDFSFFSSEFTSRSGQYSRSVCLNENLHRPIQPVQAGPVHGRNRRTGGDFRQNERPTAHIERFRKDFLGLAAVILRVWDRNTCESKCFLSNWYQSIDLGPSAAENLKFQRVFGIRRKISCDS